MICFEAQTAIVNPSKERPVWHWGIHSFGNDFLLAGSTFGWNVVGDPTLTFIRHFICFFPHANCSTWSYTDRFGLENVNSQIRETNRQLQCWGNKYNILKLWTVCVCARVYVRKGLWLDNVSLCWCVCARARLSIFGCVYVHVLAFTHAWVQSRQNFQPSCLQVCAAAASACVPLIVISIARGPLMAHTCVSHYRKLQILLS